MRPNPDRAGAAFRKFAAPESRSPQKERKVLTGGERTRVLTGAAGATRIKNGAWCGVGPAWSKVSRGCEEGRGSV